MTCEEERQLSFQLEQLLSGQEIRSFSRPEEIYAYRLIRWEADVPLTEAERQLLKDALPDAMRTAGVAAGHFLDDGESLLILLALTRFPARAHRDVVLWLCVHDLLEVCSVSLEQEGTMYIG